MRSRSFSRGVVPFLVCVLLSPVLSAQPAERGRAGPWGDWTVKTEFGGRQMESILSFSRQQGGAWTGYWITGFGMLELKDVKFEDGKLSFVQEFRNPEGQTVTSKFTGAIEEGKLSGTLSGPMGETKIEGTRSPRPSRASGIYELKMRRGDREFTSKLIIKGNERGELSAELKSERVEHKISEVKFERGALTFKTHSKMGEREWDSTFEGKLEGDALTGVLKSERGELPVQGTRVGAAAIGTWILDISTERGDRKQRLRVNPDLSALYGSTPVENVTLEGDKLSFKIVRKFGDRTFELNFEGTLSDSKLTGQVTTPMGTQKVTGTKVPRPGPRRV